MKAPRKITLVQRQLLKALLPNKKLKVDYTSLKLYGFIDNKKVCRGGTWQALLTHDYIKTISSFVYTITPKGYIALETYEGD